MPTGQVHDNITCCPLLSPSPLYARAFCNLCSAPTKIHPVQEWGRSSLALLDVREETRRLSAQVVELGLASRGGGGFGSRGRGRSGEESRRDEMALQQLLRDIEEKVGVERDPQNARTGDVFLFEAGGL